MSETHKILDGKVQLYKRPNSSLWQCSTYLGGRNHRQSTNKVALTDAIDVARDWYIERVIEDRVDGPSKGRQRRRKAGEKTFRQAGEQFIQEFRVLAGHERNAEYVASKARILRLYLNPFFGEDGITTVTAGRIHDYRLSRLAPPPGVDGDAGPGRRSKGPNGRKWKRPSRSAIHKEIVCLR